MPRHSKCFSIFRCRFKLRFIRIDYLDLFTDRQRVKPSRVDRARRFRCPPPLRPNALLFQFGAKYSWPLTLISGFTQKRGRILKGTEQLRSENEEKVSEFFKMIIKIIIHWNTTTATTTNDTWFWLNVWVHPGEVTSSSQGQHCWPTETVQTLQLSQYLCLWMVGGNHQEEHANSQ